ncbi:MAG: hypothetical protein HeimC3_31790 [Candidatus Heimdallarchaeota archaeon LC_3]|nr:MAG: hypothetical protein HeimC3_31790 [Candidatus Heimdallarchaeota archaeon LC_3]
MVTHSKWTSWSALNEKIDKEFPAVYEIRIKCPDQAIQRWLGEDTEGILSRDYKPKQKKKRVFKDYDENFFT